MTTNPFMTKVHLAQKWHTDTSKDLSDPNDIAELVLDTWEAADEYVAQHIIELLEDQKASMLDLVDDSGGMTEAALGYIKAIEHSIQRIKDKE